MKNRSGFMRTAGKILINLCKAGVTLGILIYLYKKGMLDLSRVKGVLTSPGVVATTITLLISTNLVGVVRWWWLLLGQKLKMPFTQTFQLTMIGVFFNTAIPGAVSGDVVKGYYVVRQQPDGRGRIKAFTTLLLDRLLGLSALVCVSFIAMVLNFDEMTSGPLKSLSLLITVLWLGVVLFYAFVLVEWKFSKKVVRILDKLPAGHYFVKLYEAVKAYETCRRYVFRGMAVSVAIHCTIIGVFYLLASSLGGFESVPASRFFFLVPFGLLVTAIPIAPAGLGTGHAAFLGLFKLVGADGGADLFTAFVSFQIFISLLGGLFYIRYRGHLPHDARPDINLFT